MELIQFQLQVQFAMKHFDRGRADRQMNPTSTSNQDFNQTQSVERTTGPGQCYDKILHSPTL